MSGRITRRGFLKVAGAGTAGAALFGASSVMGSRYSEYLPRGGSRMNVVLVVLDSLRKDHVGVHGNEWIKTPNLDALAGESLRFTRAYPESIPTIPARRAIQTGIRTWPFVGFDPVKGDSFMPAGWQPVPQEQTMLSEILTKQGFHTSIITDTLHMFRPSYDFQRGFQVFDFIRGQERDRYRSMALASDEEVAKKVVPGNDGSTRDKVRQYVANTTYRKGEDDWFAPQVFTRAMEFLEVAHKTEPFFLVVDSFDPHEPWDPPKKYVDLYSDGYGGPDPIAPNYSDANWIEEQELERMRALYAGEVTMTDHWLGEFLNKMTDLGFMENTLLMVLSDHGVMLGEHNITGKPPWVIWPELTDIVFYMRHPEGKAAGKTSDYFASIHDIAPTILSMTDIQRPEVMNGEDLSVLFDGKEPGARPHFTLGYNNHSWARDDSHVLIVRNDGTEAKLFDLQADPGMNKDISGKNPDVVKRMFQEYVLADAGGSLPMYG